MHVFNNELFVCRCLGGHGTFSNLVNNMVHVIMYFYYMMSAMGPQYQKYLWWKKHLTTVQLVCIDTMIYYFIIIIHSTGTDPGGERGLMAYVYLLLDTTTPPF